MKKAILLFSFSSFFFISKCQTQEVVSEDLKIVFFRLIDLSSKEKIIERIKLQPEIFADTIIDTNCKDSYRIVNLKLLDFVSTKINFGLLLVNEIGTIRNNIPTNDSVLSIAVKINFNGTESKKEARKMFSKLKNIFINNYPYERSGHFLDDKRPNVSFCNYQFESLAPVVLSLPTKVETGYERIYIYSKWKAK